MAVGVSDWLISRIGTRMSGREPETKILRELGRGAMAASSTWAEAALNFSGAFMEVSGGNVLGGAWPPGVKMMDGAVALADLEGVGRGDGFEQVFAGVAYRCLDGADGWQLSPNVLRQQGGNGRGQGAAGAEGVLGIQARGGNLDHAVAIEEEV